MRFAFLDNLKVVSGLQSTRLVLWFSAWKMLSANVGKILYTDRRRSNGRKRLEQNAGRAGIADVRGAGFKVRYCLTELRLTSRNR